MSGRSTQTLFVDTGLLAWLHLRELHLLVWLHSDRDALLARPAPPLPRLPSVYERAAAADRGDEDDGPST